ncbi:hypothetical protein [Rhodobacter amnigenus]|uniref:hypothetical protein n=1 Tax=Paragemmobacter amnigenus TaxID=2852097 RepID=UPI001E513ECA|nr:hypothetical protein [Rhodobacter amnigenus]
MSASVVMLRPQERVDEDEGAIMAIFDRLGPDPGKKLVSRAVGELALAVTVMGAQVERHEVAGLPRGLRRMQAMAAGLGMVSLAQVAEDARTALVGGDATAFAAVWARLVRVAERSLVGV